MMTEEHTPAWVNSYPDGLLWDSPIPLASVTQLLERAVERHGERPFLEFLGRRWTYREGAALVKRLAAGLLLRGLKKGERVGLFLPNCPYYVIAYYAILQAGGVVVNFNPLYPEKEIAHHIRDSQVGTIFTLDMPLMHDKLHPLIGNTLLNRIIICPLADVLPFPKNVAYPLLRKKDIVRPRRDAHHIYWKDLLAPAGTSLPLVKIEPYKDVAVLQYTGGTTGTPKAAMLTHGNVYANAVQSGLWFQGAKQGQEKLLAVIPFFHVFAMTVAMNLALYYAAEIIMLPTFELNQVLKTINDKKPTLFPAVPTIYTAIVHHPKLKKYNLSSIKECIAGGAPLPVEIKKKFEALTGCRLVEGYGLSETSPVATCNPLYGVNKAGSIGLPLPQTVVAIRSLTDPMVDVAQGERGEVCIKGPQVMAGYWGSPDETARVMLPDGFIRTGDVGIMDADGYIFIVDRIKDMILCSGYNVYPRNVEEAIYLHPAVAEVIVLGVPDEYRGQTVKAYVQLKKGQSLTADELKLFLKDKLSSIERPKQVEFRDSLPRTPIGKLSRKALLVEEAARAGKVPPS